MFSMMRGVQKISPGYLSLGSKESQRCRRKIALIENMPHRFFVFRLGYCFYFIAETEKFLDEIVPARSRSNGGDIRQMKFDNNRWRILALKDFVRTAKHQYFSSLNMHFHEIRLAVLLYEIIQCIGFHHDSWIFSHIFRFKKASRTQVTHTVHPERCSALGI